MSLSKFSIICFLNCLLSVLFSLKFHTLIRNVNKRHKRLNEKYVSIMNENNVLREHVKENEQEIENLKEKVNGKQET